MSGSEATARKIWMIEARLKQELPESQRTYLARLLAYLKGETEVEPVMPQHLLPSPPSETVDLWTTDGIIRIPQTRVDNREPTTRERQLMVLLAIDSLAELYRFLNSPESPASLTKSVPPDEEYELAFREQQEEAHAEAEREQMNIVALDRVPDTSALTRENCQHVPPYDRYKLVVGDGRGTSMNESPGSSHNGEYRRSAIPKLPALIIIALLLIAFSRQPYGFYILLRIATFVVSVYYAVRVWRKDHELWILVFAASAILYNPIAPIHMTRSDWEDVNGVTAIVLSAFLAYRVWKDLKRRARVHY